MVGRGWKGRLEGTEPLARVNLQTSKCFLLVFSDVWSMVLVELGRKRIGWSNLCKRFNPHLRNSYFLFKKLYIKKLCRGKSWNIIPRRWLLREETRKFGEEQRLERKGLKISWLVNVFPGETESKNPGNQRTCPWHDPGQSHRVSATHAGKCSAPGCTKVAKCHLPKAGPVLGRRKSARQLVKLHLPFSFHPSFVHKAVMRFLTPLRSIWPETARHAVIQGVSIK